MPALFGSRNAVPLRLLTAIGVAPVTTPTGVDIDVSAYRSLVIIAQAQGGATAAADANAYVQPYDVPLTAGVPIAMPVIRSATNLSGGTAIRYSEFSVAGLLRVRAYCQNGNATIPLNIIMDAFLQV